MRATVFVILSVLVLGALAGDVNKQTNYQAGYTQGAGNTQGGSSVLLNQLNQIGTVRGGSGATIISSSSSTTRSSGAGAAYGTGSAAGFGSNANAQFTTNVKDGQLQPLFFTTTQGSSSSVSTSSSSGQLTGAALQAEIAKLPTNAQIDQIISAANIVEITKAIQQVISSKVDCDLKIDVLTNMLGRIRSAISMKTFNIEEIRRLLATLREEIARLNQEIDDLVARQGKNNLSGRRNDLTVALTRLEAAYAAYNTANNGNTDLTTRITTINQQIQTENNKIDNVRRLITLDQQTIT
jgi:hypothetical protein